MPVHECAAASQDVGTEPMVAALPRVSVAEYVSSAVRLTFFRQGVTISLTWLWLPSSGASPPTAEQ